MHNINLSYHISHTLWIGKKVEKKIRKILGVNGNTYNRKNKLKYKLSKRKTIQFVAFMTNTLLYNMTIINIIRSICMQETLNNEHRINQSTFIC